MTDKKTAYELRALVYDKDGKYLTTITQRYLTGVDNELARRRLDDFAFQQRGAHSVSYERTDNIEV